MHEKSQTVYELKVKSATHCFIQQTRIIMSIGIDSAKHASFCHEIKCFIDIHRYYFLFQFRFINMFNLLMLSATWSSHKMRTAIKTNLMSNPNRFNKNTYSRLIHDQRNICLMCFKHLYM